MKALDPHRVTTVTDPAVVEIGVTATDGPAVGALELGTIEEDDGEVVNCTEEGALEFDVGINDAPLVGDLELGAIEEVEGEVVNCAEEEGTLELSDPLFDVGIDDGTMVVGTVEFNGVMVISAQFQNPSVSPSGEFPV